MRINGDRTSPDFWPLHFKSMPMVRLDGKEIDGAFLADDKAGIVEVIADYRGEPLRDENGFPFRRILSGKVEIIGPMLHEAVN